VNEALDAVFGQPAGGAGEDDVVTGKTQIDVAGEVDLLEYHQAPMPRPMETANCSTTSTVRSRPEPLWPESVARRVAAGRKPDSTSAG